MNPASAGFSYSVLFHLLYDETEGNIMHRTIILTGAAGHLGSTILRQLIHTDCTIRPLYTGYSLHTTSSNAMFSHMKAERELGYHFRDIHESIRDMTAYIMNQMDTVS